MNVQRIDGGDAMLDESPRPGDSNALTVVAGDPDGPTAVSGKGAGGIANCLQVMEGTWVQIGRMAAQKAELVDVGFKHANEGV